MKDNEWKEFILNLVENDKKINLKEACREKRVGLDTLYRKVYKLKQEDNELYMKFMSLHPYIPRDIKSIDFEQLMRESIISGVSQKDLENIYGVSKRTIQRRFRKINEINPELFNLYQDYLNTDSEEKLEYIIEKALEGYQKQEPLQYENEVKNRRQEFIDRIKQMEENPSKAKNNIKITIENKL